MNTTAIVTIVSNNYLHFARTLMQSVAQQHPQANRFCVVVDRDPTPAASLSDEFLALALAQLDLPDGDDFLFQYNILELNTAVKPWAIAYLLRRGYLNVVYIDPDIVLYQPLQDVFSLLEQGANLVLTPHLLAPVTDTLHPDELDIRRAGAYNLGFCAFRNSPTSLALLAWWQGKLRRDCIIAHDRGIFVDQSWIDLAPGLFDNVCVLRHPGYNLAYWNFAQRSVLQAGEQTLVAGESLVFMHFSGLNPLAPQAVSKYQNRYTLSNLSAPLVKLINDYCQRVQANGLARYSAMTYGYGQFEDGTPITDADRSRFRTNPELRRFALGNPFACRQLRGTPPSPPQSPVLVTEPKPRPNHEQAAKPDPALVQIYEHFLGRSPDKSGVDSYKKSNKNMIGRALITYNIATSREAKSKPGWFLRLLSWPLRHAALPSAMPSATPNPLPAPSAARLAVQPVLPMVPPARPSPYGGLHAPEPESHLHGLWVGPRLDLPVCAIGAGQLTISGFIDLGLLSHVHSVGDFHLHIHSPTGLLHSAALTTSGPFTIALTLPKDAFDLGSQWTIMASSHIVPKDQGLSEDIRALAWRVNLIAVDDCVLIDSARSPTTRAIEHLISPAGINLIGYLAAELGLGEAARSLARACVAADIPFSAVDVGFQSQNLQRDTTVQSHAVSKRFAIDLMYVNADQTAATAAYLQANNLQSRYRIGYWHWEQPELPSSALGAFAYVDEVWVPSTFVHDAVAPYAPVPVVKIPHAISFTPSPRLDRSQFGLPPDKLLVLVMYDFHSYQYRKNPQAALQAFRKSAGRRSDVVLVIKTINGQHYPQASQQLQESVADLPQVIFINTFFTRQQTWDLQACSDILLSLHRAEGFGLAPAEMMYLGKPVIATGWSANMDFMTTDNSFPVRYQLQALQQAVGVYPAGQLWAEADTDHAAWCLASLLDDASLRHAVGSRAAADIRRQLAPSAVGALVARRLSLLGLWQPQTSLR